MLIRRKTLCNVPITAPAVASSIEDPVVEVDAKTEEVRNSDDDAKPQLNTESVKEAEEPDKVVVNVSLPPSRFKRRRKRHRLKIGVVGIDDNTPSLPFVDTATLATAASS